MAIPAGGASPVRADSEAEDVPLRKEQQASDEASPKQAKKNKHLGVVSTSSTRTGRNADSVEVRLMLTPSPHLSGLPTCTLPSAPWWQPCLSDTGSRHVQEMSRDLPDVALFCLRKANPVRRGVIRIIKHRFFTRVVLFVILLNCVSLAFSSQRPAFALTPEGKFLGEPLFPNGQMLCSVPVADRST